MAWQLAARLLQQDASETGGPPPLDDSPSAQQANEPLPSTLDLRIIAIFVILASGFLGGLLPLVLKCFRNPAHPATLILRALAAGVMLSLAIVHVIPDGIADLGEVHDYPFGPLAVVFGILVMVMTESMSRSFLHSKLHDPLHGGTAAEAQPPQLQQPSQPQQPHQAQIALTCTSAPDLSKASMSSACGQCVDGANPARPNDNHSHTCLGVNNAASWAANPQSASVRNQILAYMFELACIVHSFLIGIALGVTVDSRQQALALLVALVFHQGLEGVGLGSTIVRASFGRWKGLAMIATYAIMTPLGVAIGIAIADTYDGESVTALGVQGTLNSVSGGLLLYISLVQLIAEDFTRDDILQFSGWFQAAMHAALAVGAGCMAVLGIWA